MSESVSNSTFMKWKYYFINVGEVENNISINRLDVVSRIKVPDQLLKIKKNEKSSNFI